MFGLDEETLATIRAGFAGVRHTRRAILFGSRALGNYKPASDIDLCITGEGADADLPVLRAFFEEAPRFPYKVDIVHYETISKEALKRHVDEHGMVIWEK